MRMIRLFAITLTIFPVFGEWNVSKYTRAPNGMVELAVRGSSSLALSVCEVNLADGRSSLIPLRGRAPSTDATKL